MPPIKGIGKRDPNITITRQGVQNYIKTIKRLDSSKEPFPIKRIDLQTYIKTKIEDGVSRETLSRYIGDIKSHNIAIKKGWDYSVFEPLLEQGLRQLRTNKSRSISDVTQDRADRQLHASDSGNIPSDSSSPTYAPSYLGNAINTEDWIVQYLREGDANRELTISNSSLGSSQAYPQNCSENVTLHPEQTVDLMNSEKCTSSTDQNICENNVNSELSMNNSFTIPPEVTNQHFYQTSPGNNFLLPGQGIVFSMNAEDLGFQPDKHEINRELSISNSPGMQSQASPLRNAPLNDFINSEKCSSRPDQNLGKGVMNKEAPIIDLDAILLSAVPYQVYPQAFPGNIYFQGQEYVDRMTVTETWILNLEYLYEIFYASELNKLLQLLTQTTTMHSDSRRDLRELTNRLESGYSTREVFLEFDKHLREVEDQVSCLRLEVKKFASM
ncbi:846_t:CDS:2 [Acaulospora morrowiae]|uniref:846_t:CDS:1 n=1 Tax=Acaulospora morrowiae TaxID=94023 RepID=A0A9N9FKU3_9GLOM|nr:846_t:CDS:2 [Acaulospora morrowiae]